MDTNKEYTKSPRTIAACYFTFLSLVTTAIIQIILNLFGHGNLIPIFASFIISVVVACFSSIIFGKAIINSKKSNSIKCFIWGMFLVLFSIAIYDFFLLFIIKTSQFKQYNFSNTFQDQFLLYLMILIYSITLIGSWLSILGGFTAIYLRDKFVPNLFKFSNKDN